MGECGSVWESVGEHTNRSSTIFLGPTDQNHLRFKEVQELSYHQKNYWGDPGSLNVFPDVFMRHGDFAKHRAFARATINPIQTLETCHK